MKICINAHFIIPGCQISWKKESTHSTCPIINSAEGYTVRGSFNWSFLMKGQLLGEWFLWASRTFTQGWRGGQTMGLALKQSGGNLQHILEMLKSTCRRTKRRPIEQIHPTERKTCHLTSTTRCDVSLERPRLTTKILRCQTSDLSCSVELSAAVLKQTPQQEGWRPYSFLKQARGDLEDIKILGTA